MSSVFAEPPRHKPRGQVTAADVKAHELYTGTELRMAGTEPSASCPICNARPGWTHIDGWYA